MKLRGYKKRSQKPLVEATWDDDFIFSGNYLMLSEQPPHWIRHLGILGFFFSETSENDPKMTQKQSKSIKSSLKRLKDECC